MNPKLHDYLWIISELLYYFGLVLSVIGIPGLTLSLWALSLADIVNPNYVYLGIAWAISIFMFLGGVLLKNILIE